MKQTSKGLLIPLIFHRRRQRPSIVHLSSASTGILLGVFLLHILPCSTQRLRHALEGSVYQTYPGALVLPSLELIQFIRFLQSYLIVNIILPSLFALLNTGEGGLDLKK